MRGNDVFPSIDFPITIFWMRMNKYLLATVVMVFVTACGGGSSSPSSNGSPVSTTVPPTGSVAAPAPSASQIVDTAPAAPASALQLTAKSFIEGGSGKTVVKFTAAADLTLYGELASIWLSAAQTGGSVTISGKSNTVVFMPGTDTAVTLSDTAAGNTIYLPLNSPIKLTGAGLAANTVRYYKS